MKITTKICSCARTVGCTFCRFERRFETEIFLQPLDVQISSESHHNRGVQSLKIYVIHHSAVIFGEQNRAESKKMTSFVSRVNQLDSDLLDKEITKIINEQLANVYKELPPGILSKFQPEIDCALKSLVWFSSIQLNKATFGQQVLAISYQNSAITKNRLILHYLLTICTPYAKDVCALRFVNHLRIQKILQWLDCCWRILTVFNFFRFLKVGVYPSLVDYCLRWNIQSANGQKMRNVGYDYMNRELMWTGFLVSRDFYLVVQIHLFFILFVGTSKCHDTASQPPCDEAQLGNNAET